jgi:hypothetical protein
VLQQAPGCGFLFPAGDASALARGLQPLLSDPEKLIGAKRASRHAAEVHFSWESEHRRLLDALTNWPAASSDTEFPRSGSELVPLRVRGGTGVVR